MTRNRDQHPESILCLNIHHSKWDRATRPSPFFVSEGERVRLTNEETSALSWMDPTVEVTRDGLFTAIEHVERLVDWLEPKLQDARWARQKKEAPSEGA